MHPLAVQLLSWYEVHKRDLPWRNTRDPYLIWLSEIILQQTRVDQGLPYYLAFSSSYPDVNKLAGAPEDEVLRLWQGLGYYSRARNLHKCAKIVASEYKGEFPKDYKTLLSLPGIGKYTASAVSSIAGGEKAPVIDGNVYRVTTRYFNISDDISTPATYNKIHDILIDIIPDKNPGEFNQSVMELGATVCKPQNPRCSGCPVKMGCVARKEDLIASLPFKRKKTRVRKRIFNYLVFENGGKLHLKKRVDPDIWQGLYDFPLIESKDPLSSSELKKVLAEEYHSGIEVMESSAAYDHILSHQKITAQFHHV